MAIGDAAAAAGMDLVSGTQPANEIGDEINKTRDYLAPALEAVEDATATATEGKLVKYGTGARINVGTPQQAGNATRKDYVDAGLAQKAEADTVANIQAGEFTSAVWNRDITSTRRAVVMSEPVGGYSDFGWASSKRAKKQNISDAGMPLEVLRQIPVVVYRYRAAVAAERSGGPAAAYEIGTIADDLDALGLTKFVIYVDGTPAGVHYDLLSLAALSLAQQLADRLDTIESRLEALEGE